MNRRKPNYIITVFCNNQYTIVIIAPCTLWLPFIIVFNHKTISKSVGFNFSPQKYSFLTATEIYFIGGGKYCPGIPMTLKCVKQFAIHIIRVCAGSTGTGFALKPGFAESNTIRVNNFRPTRPPGRSKNVILCFLANMKYLRDTHR